MQNNPHKLLTITIPSFNRNKLLKDNLIKLLSVSNIDKCKILVIDNNSDIKVQETLKDINYSKHDIEIVRNNINIGINGNILKCFELCKTKWMWILSDDDVVFENSIDTIMTSISSIDNDVISINFGSSIDQIDRTTYQYVSNAYELTKSQATFSSVLFLSTNIYNHDLIFKYFSSGINYAYTYLPHVAIMLSGLEDDKKMYISKDRIVEWSNDIDEISWSIIDMTLKRRQIMNMTSFINSDHRKEIKSYILNGYNNWKTIIKYTDFFLSSDSLIKKRKVLKSILRNSNYDVMTIILYILYRILLIAEFTSKGLKIFNLYKLFRQER